MKKLFSVSALALMTSLMLSIGYYQNSIAVETEHVEIMETYSSSPMIEQQIEVIERDLDLATDDEIELIALVTMAEAEGESELGKRLVIDTILNRLDHEDFPNDIYEVIYQENQFSSMWNGRVDKCYVDDDICELVREELKIRINNDVLFFHAGKYGKYGDPVFNVGNHYFSSL